MNDADQHVNVNALKNLLVFENSAVIFCEYTFSKSKGAYILCVSHMFYDIIGGETIKVNERNGINATEVS